MSDAVRGSAELGIDKTHQEQDLKPVPGEKGLPFIGKTVQIVKDPIGFGAEMREQYGNIYKTNSFFREVISLFGPEANEFVLMDRERNFSNKLGWDPYLGRLFTRGLMMLDFDHHKAHRHIMAAAFKSEPMRGYLERLNAEIPPAIKKWGETKRFAFYPAIKKLSLDLATHVFLGLKPNHETEQVNIALSEMTRASMGLVRIPLPFTPMGKGVKARQFMIKFLARHIPARRGSDASDIFTQLCNATDDDGNAFTDQEVIDHMIFLWMAAHDTITSSVTTLVYELGRHPVWQGKIRQEIIRANPRRAVLTPDTLAKLTLTDYAFKEALRMNPPVPMMPRRAVRDTSFDGYHIPKGSIVSISPLYTHRSPELWDKPEAFNPLRFSAEGGAKERHRFAWIPYGGGAHMCLGLHFAVMQTKAIMANLLPNYYIRLPEGYKTEFQIMPLIKPKDGLPITLDPVGSNRS